MKEHVESIVAISDRIRENVSDKFKRFLYKDIDFNCKLVIITGFRGVGKTTLLLQQLNTHPGETSIYLSLDHIIFSEFNMYSIVDSLYMSGYRTLVLDEIHKYPSWSTELKNIYDSFPNLKVLATSSSALDIMAGKGDLSRRADVYELPGLSFREFLELEYNHTIQAFSFDELLEVHIEIAELLTKSMDVNRRHNLYKKRGYFPYFKESPRRYHERIRNAINQVIDVDLPPIFAIDYHTTRQIKKLLSILSRAAPFKPNIAKISRDTGITRSRILLFLDYLESADIISILKSNTKSDSAMTKPDRIFLANTNFIHALGINDPNIGAERESLFMANVSVRNHVTTPAKGDFLVDNKYAVEVGGKNKGFHQLDGMANPIVVKEGILVGSKNILPLWMTGLLY